MRFGETDDIPTPEKKPLRAKTATGKAKENVGATMELEGEEEESNSEEKETQSCMIPENEKYKIFCSVPDELEALIRERVKEVLREKDLDHGRTKTLNEDGYGSGLTSTRRKVTVGKFRQHKELKGKAIVREHSKTIGMGQTLREAYYESS